MSDGFEMQFPSEFQGAPDISKDLALMAVNAAEVPSSAGSTGEVVNVPERSKTFTDPEGRIITFAQVIEPDLTRGMRLTLKVETPTKDPNVQNTAEFELPVDDLPENRVVLMAVNGQRIGQPYESGTDEHARVVEAVRAYGVWSDEQFTRSTAELRRRARGGDKHVVNPVFSDEQYRDMADKALDEAGYEKK